MLKIKYIVVSVCMVLVLASCSDKEKDITPVEVKITTPAFTVATVQKGGVSTTIKLPGQLVAYQEVSILPKVNGYVKTVLVDIGSKVKKGALLMVLEAPELAQATLQAKEKYARTQVDFTIDKERYNRLLEASKTAGAISPLDLSTVKAKMEADGLLCNAEKANWQMQQTMQGYLRVVAPFAGIITERNIHPGALVSNSAKDKPMLELKQVDQLRLQIEIPEGVAANLKDKDKVSFYVSALQGKKMTGFIKRVSMNENAQYRSERMEVDVLNKEETLTPGMFADVVLYSKGNPEALFVPKAAVVISTERKYVLVVKDKKITRVDVTTGNANVGTIEVFGALNEGDKVVAVANDEVKEVK